MKILITTYGRIGAQKTAETLAAADIDFKLLVQRPENRDDYDVKWRDRVMIMPAVSGLTEKRNWVIRNMGGKVVLLDDDLTFYSRKNNWRSASPSDVRAMMRAISKQLDCHAHGGVANKFMSHALPPGKKSNQQYIHILCYNLDKFPPNLQARTQCGSEHDINLQLLKSGLSGFLLTDWAHADKPMAPGGCATYRTREMLEQHMLDLEQLHPGVVTVVHDEKMKRHMGSKMKMRVSWRKAAQMGGCA